VSTKGKLTREVWRAHCEAVRDSLGQRLKHLEDNDLIECTRDYSHIESILELDKPMDALCLLEHRLLAALTGARGKVSDFDFALLVRDTLLTLMMIRNPLRASHWERMTYRTDGTGHLRKMRDGNYELRFSKREFKAVSGIRQKEYRAFVSPDLTWLIDEYLTCWRLLLEGSRHSACVFVSSSCEAGRKRKYFFIGDIIVSATARYLQEYAPRGFAPHGMRHIIATHLVKNYLDGISRAAAALHNTEAMIQKHYGHLRAEDVTRRAHELIAGELAAGRERVGAR
jgi:hypothetical protein